MSTSVLALVPSSTILPSYPALCHAARDDVLEPCVAAGRITQIDTTHFYFRWLYNLGIEFRKLIDHLIENIHRDDTWEVIGAICFPGRRYGRYPRNLRNLLWRRVQDHLLSRWEVRAYLDDLILIPVQDQPPPSSDEISTPRHPTYLAPVDLSFVDRASRHPEELHDIVN